MTQPIEGASLATAFALTVAAGLATVIGGLLALLPQALTSRKILAGALGLAAGPRLVPQIHVSYVEVLTHTDEEFGKHFEHLQAAPAPQAGAGASAGGARRLYHVGATAGASAPVPAPDPTPAAALAAALAPEPEPVDHSGIKRVGAVGASFFAGMLAVALLDYAINKFIKDTEPDVVAALEEAEAERDARAPPAGYQLRKLALGRVDSGCGALSFSSECGGGEEAADPKAPARISSFAAPRRPSAEEKRGREAGARHVQSITAAPEPERDRPLELVTARSADAGAAAAASASVAAGSTRPALAAPAGSSSKDLLVLEDTAEAGAPGGCKLGSSSSGGSPTSDLEVSGVRLLSVAIVTWISITMHNIPEGLASFLSLASDLKVGGAVAFAIAVHNIPEGISVGITVLQATKSRKKAILWCFLSGISEPVGAAIGWGIIDQGLTSAASGIVFGLVGGVMVFTAVVELLPTAFRIRAGDKFTAASIVLGMLIMHISFVLFEI
eukprot:tig00020943_g16268.t1